MSVALGLSGLGGVAQQNGDCVFVDLRPGRPWECGPVEQGLCRPVQA
jgi:hypothetical protein